jgi:DNA-binding PadR family transcriptional regulator
VADCKSISRFLPLTESTYYIMLALTEPLHGYGAMQRIEELSGGTVRVGPGTLYGAFTTLEKAGLIVRTGEEDRRKSYTLTATGREVLTTQIQRLETMILAGRAVPATGPDHSGH